MRMTREGRHAMPCNQQANWSEEEQARLDAALEAHPATMERKERWKASDAMRCDAMRCDAVRCDVM